MTLASLLHRLFHGPAWLSFLVMGLATAGAALCTLHLFEMFEANYALIREYGSMAVFDGGLIQFFELVFWGYLGLGCYFIFKGCLDGLLARVHRAAPGRKGRP
jgi:hypothetical protein